MSKPRYKVFVKPGPQEWQLRQILDECIEVFRKARLKQWDKFDARNDLYLRIERLKLLLYERAEGVKIEVLEDSILVSEVFRSKPTNLFQLWIN